MASEYIGNAEKAEATTTDEPPVKMSKNQLKKKRKLERMIEVKKRRKQQEKEIKMAKAKAQGRDLEEERRQLEARTREGRGRKIRQERLEERLTLAKKSFQVCLDCAFESSMTSKEIGSLALQIRYCYANNKRSQHPCLLAATSLGNESATLKHLKNVSGIEEWQNRGFTITSQSFEDYYRSDLHNVVYLTSDSDHTLQELDDDKVYIIGGIVDRNRLKRAAIERAQKLGVATAKLPIDEHLQKMEATRVLTCNHVFELLLKYREYGKDWKKALLDVLPHRKDAKVLEDGKD